MLERFFYTWDNWPLATSTASTTHRCLYNPETHDLVPKKEYVQREIDRLSEELKRAENKEKEIKKYWREKQDEIKDNIAKLTKRLED